MRGPSFEKERKKGKQVYFNESVVSAWRVRYPLTFSKGCLPRDHGFHRFPSLFHSLHALRSADLFTNRCSQLRMFIRTQSLIRRSALLTSSPSSCIFLRMKSTSPSVSKVELSHVDAALSFWFGSTDVPEKKEGSIVAHTKC